MKVKKNYLVFLSFISCCCAAQTWQQLGNFPAAGRDDGSVFKIGSSVYCGLGNAQGIGPATDFYKFDLQSEAWLGAVASLPALGRQYCCSFSYNNYGFIATGVDANWNATNEVWRYDTVTNAWQQRTPMPDSVQGASCFFINNKAYVCGGRNQANQCVNKVWEYDVVGNSWTQKNNMPDGGRWRASAAVVNGKGYLVFGADANGKFSNKLYEYDAGNDGWALIDSFPGQGRTYAAAATIGNFLVVALGIDSSNAVHNDCYLYDVVGHQRINQNALPSFGRKGCMSFANNNAFYITAGIDGQNTRLTETWKAGSVNGIENFSVEDEVRVFPNPVSDVLHIEALFGNYEVEMSNVMGEKVAVLKDINNVDVKQFLPGLYFLRIRNRNKILVKKFLISR